MGGLTPCQELVDTVLAPEDDKEKTILDIGMRQLLLYLIYIYVLLTTP